ncbi:MAG TPA: 2-oxoacid:acceptor oxidoreductase family protein [Candidatus Tectomicrobia bacterium]|nr:2-oxoacid:acceptor oxidoreductase family protein [Candidatus Tectomicrobia bacterium]
MLRIRFHGRGGQGMKTASRIVGTAAFHEGHYAQDAPLYGAERRGAPMAAFTRIDAQPILERGLIAAPDIVVVADETLLIDPQVLPLQGLTPHGTLLLNSSSAPGQLHGCYDITGRFAVLDGTQLVLTHLGSLAGLSVALGAATCRLAGLSRLSMERAVREELQALELDGDQIARNLAVAQLGYEQLIIEAEDRAPAMAAPLPSSISPQVVTPTYQGALRGTPSVVAAANTPLRKTGNWRVWRPVIDLTHCSQCWMCFVSCPDGAIALDHDDNPHIDYDVCKGCLICVEECPTHAISKILEAVA